MMYGDASTSRSMVARASRALESTPPARSRFPGRWKRRPADRLVWRRFLKLADKASSTKERGEFLKLAFMATLKGETGRGSDDAMDQYLEEVNREGQQAIARYEQAKRNG